MIGGIIVLVFLVTFGLFLSDAESVTWKWWDEIEPIIYDDDYIIDKFVGGLERPVAMTFVGDDILVIEKETGRVIQITRNGISYKEPVLDVPVAFKWEAGLLGIASLSDHVFLYFTESLSNSDQWEIENARNVVYQYDWNGEKLINPILIKELPAFDTNHFGGVIATGLNNEIYFTLGDLRQFGIYQNIISGDNVIEAGVIYKIDTEKNNKAEIVAMGIRNSFGLALDPITGYLWDTENGPDAYDEINLVETKFNSGWAKIQGPSNGKLLPQLPNYEEYEYSEPEFSWELPIGVTAIEFPNSKMFEKYENFVFVADVNNGNIYKFKLDDTRTKFIFESPYLQDNVLNILENSEDAAFSGDIGCLMSGIPCYEFDPMDEILFGKNFGMISDMKFGPDGALYVISLMEGKIYRITLG